MRFVESFNTLDTAIEFHRSLHVGFRLGVLGRRSSVYTEGCRHFVVYYTLKSMPLMTGSLRYHDGGTVVLSMAVRDREISTCINSTISDDVRDRVGIRDALSRLMNRVHSMSTHGA